MGISEVTAAAKAFASICMWAIRARFYFAPSEEARFPSILRNMMCSLLNCFHSSLVSGCDSALPSPTEVRRVSADSAGLQQHLLPNTLQLAGLLLHPGSLTALETSYLKHASKAGRRNTSEIDWISLLFHPPLGNRALSSIKQFFSSSSVPTKLQNHQFPVTTSKKEHRVSFAICCHLLN